MADTAGTADLSEVAGISADEVALYDRQIRLWGMEAQSRIRNADILIIGMKALGNETAKNLVLAGIGSLTVLDPNAVESTDLGAQFFIQEKDVGSNRAEAAAPAIQRLNPRVRVETITDPISSLPADFFSKFDIVIATELDLTTLTLINTQCRNFSRPFYAAATYGLYGYVFADLLSHQFVIERDKSNLETRLVAETRTRRVVAARTKKEGDKVVEFVTKEEIYSPLITAVECPIDPTWRPRRKRAVPPALSCIMALWEFEKKHVRRPTWPNKEDTFEFTRIATATHAKLGLPTDTLKSSFLASLLAGSRAELAPVTAVLGGVLAQDVINVLGKREQPLQNFLVFDGDASVGPIFSLHPEDVDVGKLVNKEEENSKMAVDGALGEVVDLGGDGGANGLETVAA